MTVNEPFFQGHFPGYPVMPGVLIVEAMAQTGAVLMSKSLDVDAGGKTIFFMSLDNCRFRAPVRPGDVLRMPVEVVRARGDIFKFRGRAMVGDKVAAEAEFAAMVVETRAERRDPSDRHRRQGRGARPTASSIGPYCIVGPKRRASAPAPGCCRHVVIEGSTEIGERLRRPPLRRPRRRRRSTPAYKGEPTRGW